MEKVRRYDLDWLRVIVFGLLVFYHVGMFFVPWDFHIKNNTIYDWIKWPMLFLNQWRLPTLFIISGMGTYFALAFRSGGQFIEERQARLGLPLLFGMLFIIPPQVYIERFSDQVFTGTYLEFWMGPAFDGIYPSGNLSWHHLWFLPYLLVFSLILAPVFLRIRSNPDSRFLNGWRNRITKHPFSLYWFVIPLFLYESLLEPFFDVIHNLVWDWFNFISSLTLFFYGFLLIVVREAFWRAIDQIKSHTLIIGIFSFGAMLVIWLFIEDSIIVHFIEALFKVVNLWSWILTIFGFAAVYLNRKSKLLSYCNQAVYPFYILHQTVMLVIAYFLMNLTWGFLPKFLILVAGTFLISWLLYEFLVRRVFFLRPLFGLKEMR